MYCPNPLQSTLVCVFSFIFLSTINVWSQTAEEKKTIRERSNITEMAKLVASFTKEALVTHEQFKLQKRHNEFFQNQKQLDGTVVRLNGLGSDGTLLYYTTHMDPTSKLSRADALHAHGELNLGLSGRGMAVGIWDAGVARTTHQEFDARVTNNDGGEVDNHGTLVTGTVVSSGVKQNSQGVAYNADALTFDWSLDKKEVAEAALNGLLLSNHSYGIKTDRVPDWYFGSYIKVSQDWDNIMYNAPYYLMVTAAGNARNSYDNESPNFGRTQDGYDLLVGFTTAKNGLVIAGANADIDRKGNLKNAEISSYSSYGPTDDGRIKPDLAGDGTLINSTSSNSDSSYSSTMGTSMAAPGVTGSLLLLQEYHNELYGQFMKAATLKGLTLHTADDVQEPGPDYKMGWGVINVKKAAETLRNKDFSSMIMEEHLQEGETITYTIKSNGVEPLSASISWTDVAGTFVNRGNLNASIAALTNDLDIRITKAGETYYPWKLNPSLATDNASKGDNWVDPYERIDIPNAEGEYTITISHKGNLVNTFQDFSLIVSGVELIDCRLEAPTEIQITTFDESGTNLIWTSEGTEALYELELKEERSKNWETHTLWNNTFSLENLVQGITYRVKVRSVCSQNLTSEFSQEIEFVFNGEETILEKYEPFAIDQEVSIKVYPNPAVNELEVEAELSKDAFYSVVSTDGNIVKTGKFEDFINVSDLATGLYVLTIQDYSGIRSTKFVKD